MISKNNSKDDCDIRFSSFPLRLLPKSVIDYAILIRLDRAIGYWLLFWPCVISTGLALSAHSDISSDFHISDFIFYLCLYYFGSIMMRGAGCVLNDIIDRKLDRQVLRTSLRPLAAQRISVFKAILLMFLLLAASCIILFQFNLATIYFGFLCLPLIAIYPFAKRFTWYPQAMLGVVFNWGVIIGYCAIVGRIDLTTILLHIALFFWTIGYDTIYACQDIEDDIRFGVYSTALRYRYNVKRFLLLCYILCIIFLFIVLFFAGIMNFFSLLFFSLFCIHLFYQWIRFNESDGRICLSLFRANHLAGFLIAVCFCVSYLFAI